MRTYPDDGEDPLGPDKIGFYTFFLKEEEHYEETNNYYHNENYRGNNRGCKSYRGQQGGSRKPYRGNPPNLMGVDDDQLLAIQNDL